MEDLFFFIQTLFPETQKATLHVCMEWYDTSYK